MSINRAADKEDMGGVYMYIHTIHNGIFLSHKIEQNWVIYRDIDGPRDSHCRTE